MATLSPETKPARPNDRAGTYWFSVADTGGVRVDEITALTLGVVFACVRVISESLAGLPWFAFSRRRDGGLDQLPGHPVNWLLDVQANPETPAFQWRESLVAHALTWGNGYAEIERDLAGRPVWLWQLTPDRVCPERDVLTGRIVYRIRNYGAPDTYLPMEDVYHLRGLGFDGLMGYPVIRLGAKEIGLAMSIQSSAANLANNDSTPGGILEHPQRLTSQARDNLRESWQRRHGGPKNRRTVAILEEGMKWQQTGLPPEDAQLIEQMQFTPAMLCRWFRVPPHKIHDLSRATFSNIEEQNIEFAVDTLRPWAERLESEADIKLFGRTNRGTVVTIIDMNEVKRGDTESQMQFVRESFDRGVLSVNEARAYFGRNPIGPDGDKRFVMANMQLLEKAGEEPAPRPPASGPIPEPSANGDAAEDVPVEMRAMRPVIEDAVQRVMRREANGAAKSRKRIAADNGKWAAWLTEFSGEQASYAREALRPGLTAAALLAGSPQSAQVVLELFLQRYTDGFPARCAAEMDYDEVVGEFSGSLLHQIIAAAAAGRAT